MYNQSGTVTKKEHQAYHGNVFAVEWYFDEKGQSQALNYYKKLAINERNKIMHLIIRISDFGVIHDTTKFNYEGDQIFAFKPQPNRFLCFFYSGKKIIVTNAFRKHTQLLPKNEKIRALRYKKNFETRIMKNSYYEK